jgi:AraC-like DNA-binding protein
VSADKIGRLLEASAQRSGKVDFGLRLAEGRTLSNVGAFALLVREQPTIRKALEVLVGYMFLHSESLHFDLQEQDGLIAFTLTIEVDSPIPIRQSVELGIGFVHRSFAQLFRERWKPLAVCFTHAAPAKKEAYRKFFATEIRFNQDFNGLLCSASDLDVPVPAADAKMARHVKQYLDTLTSRQDSTMSSLVRECIYTMLPSGLCSTESVAKRLGLDRKTMYRRLQADNQTFSSLMDNVRLELVTRYVGNKHHSLTSVAELLGFSQLSAFSRWFRAQFGCSVSEWRSSQSISRELVRPSRGSNKPSCPPTARG